MPQETPKKKKLPPEQERQFQSWYSQWAGKLDLNPNPDDPLQYYDYRAAWQAGATPDSASGWHWPSEFKLPGHPNLIVDGINTKTGERVKSDNFGPILMGFPFLQQSWRTVNPENIRPMPSDRAAQDEGRRRMTRVVAARGPGYVEPDLGRGAVDYPGHMDLTTALNNSFVRDTLDLLMGRPQGGIGIYPGISWPTESGRPMYATNPDNPEEVMLMAHRSRRGRQPGRIFMSSSELPEDDFANSLTHEYVHEAQDSGVRNRPDLSQRLQNFGKLFGPEPTANAIARALEAVRNSPGESQQFHADVTSVQHGGLVDRYPSAAADSAVAWIYSLLGRE